LVLPGHASEPLAFDQQPIMTTIGAIRMWLSDWM
jgi:hypothetical protein